MSGLLFVIVYNCIYTQISWDVNINGSLPPVVLILMLVCDIILVIFTTIRQIFKVLKHVPVNLVHMLWIPKVKVEEANQHKDEEDEPVIDLDRCADYCPQDANCIIIIVFSICAERYFLSHKKCWDAPVGRQLLSDWCHEHKWEKKLGSDKGKPCESLGFDKESNQPYQGCIYDKSSEQVDQKDEDYQAV